VKILQVANVRWLNAEVDYALRLSSELSRRGHQVHFAGLPGVEPTMASREMGLQTTDLDGLNTNNPLGWFSAHGLLRRLVETERYDLVCAHRSEGYALLAAAVRRGSPKTVLVRTRGDMRPPRKGPLNRVLYGRWADGLTASGEIVKEMMVENLGIDPARIRVIYYGVNTAAFRPDLKDRPGPRGLPPGDLPVVGYVGRLGRTKGEEHLLRAMSLLAESNDQIRFVLAVKEEGDYPDQFTREVNRAGLGEKTVVLGRVEDLPGLLNRFTVGVISSIGSEANCRVALEMMACGVPVTATRVGVIPEVVLEGETGFLVPPGEPEALALAVTRLLNDQALRHKMARSAAGRVADNFALGDMGRKTEEWYGELVDAKEK
jgi:glycosyltransferase involved in cell wall biosynthesis